MPPRACTPGGGSLRYPRSVRFRASHPLSGLGQDPALIFKQLCIRFTLRSVLAPNARLGAGTSERA